MAKLFGAQRMVLQALLEAQGDSQAFIEDSRIAQSTRISPRDMRDWFLTLDHDELVDLALTESGLSASVNAKGRLALGLYRPFPTTIPSSTEPAKISDQDREEKALVIGISAYPNPIPRLPAVANDVREMGKVLSSDNGQFPAENVTSLIDAEATSTEVLKAIETTFSGVQPDDAVLPTWLVTGGPETISTTFVAHNTNVTDIPSTGVLSRRSNRPSTHRPVRRAFLWLDFCHSGGIIPRELEAGSDDRGFIGRALKVVQGQGKLIIAPARRPSPHGKIPP